jgi:hypothetical protein
VNMDLSGDQSFGHGSIDKSERLHTLVIEKIKKVAITPNKKRTPPKTDNAAATTGSVGAKPAAAPAANAPASAKPAASAAAKPASAPPPPPTPIANQQNPRT